jgi:hypothetical protein
MTRFALLHGWSAVRRWRRKKEEEQFIDSEQLTDGRQNE